MKYSKTKNPPQTPTTFESGFHPSQLADPATIQQFLHDFVLQADDGVEGGFQLGRLGRLFFGEDFEKMVGRSHHSLNELQTRMNEVMLHFDGVIKDVGDQAPLTMLLVQMVAAFALAYLIYYLGKKIGHVKALALASTVGGTFTAFAMRRHLRQPVMNGIAAIQQFFQKKGDFQIQDGTADATLALGSVSMFVLLSAFLVGIVPKHSSIEKFLRRVDEAGKSAKGFQALASFIEPAALQITQLYRRHLGVEIEPDDAVGVWCKKFEEMIAEPGFEDRLSSDGATFERFMRLYQTSIGLRLSLRELTYAEKEVFIRCQGRLFKYFEVAVRSPVGLNAMKAVPLTILLKGKSGIGKSSITNFVAFDVFREQILEYVGENSPVSGIYPRLHEQVYWDSYAGQPIVGVDDAFQIVDSVSSPDPIIFELIRMVNPWPYFLHMAKLEHKDNTILQAKGVIMTSNHWPQINSIRTPEAFLRRIHVCAEVRIKDEYVTHGRTETVHFEKALSDQGGDFPVAMNMYDFCLVDPSRPDTVLQTLSYEEFVAYCRNFSDKLRKSTGGFAAAAEYYFKNGGIDNIENLKKDFVLQNGDLQCGEEDDEDKYEDASDEEPTSWPEIFNHSTETDGILHEDADVRKEKEASYCHLLLSRLKLTRSSLEDMIKDQYDQLMEAFYRDVNEEEEDPDGAEICTTFQESRLRASNSATMVRAFEVISTKYREYLDRIYEQPLVVTTVSVLTTAALVGVLIKTVSWFYTIQEDGEDDEGYEGRDRQAWSKSRNTVMAQIPTTSEIFPDLDLDVVDVEEQLKQAHAQSKEVKALIAEKYRPQSKETKTPKPRRIVIQDRPFADPLREVGLRDVEDHEDQEKELEGEEFYKHEQIVLTTDGIGALRIGEHDSWQMQPPVTPNTIKQQSYIHASNDQQSFQLQHKMVLHVMDVQIFNHVDDVKHIGNAVGVTSNIILTNAHIYNVLVALSQNEDFDGGNTRIKLCSYNLAEGLQFTINEVEAVARVPGKDAILIKLPRKFPQFPDIRKHFIDYEEAGKFVCVAGNLITITQSGRSPLVANTHVLPVVRAAEMELNAKSQQGGTVTISSRPEIKQRGAYTYAGDYKNGNCGGLLFARNSYLKAKILGIHVAFSPSTHVGVAVALFREEINEAIRQLGPGFIVQGFGYDSGLVQEKLPSNLDHIVPGEFITIGVAKPVGLPTKTKLKPSLFHERVTPCTTAPAHLKKFQTTSGLVIDPIKRGLAKAGKPDIPVDDDELDNVCKEVFDVYFNGQFEVPLPLAQRNTLILDFDEAVKGFDGDPDFPSINRSTSCGYPFVLDPEVQKAAGKRYFFGEEAEFDLKNERVENLRFLVAEREEKCRSGTRPDTIWMDLPKDEKRELAKVAVGKTRMFVCGPIDYNILFVQYFGAARACVNQRVLKNESAIGINPYGAMWDILRMKLTKHGKKIVAGDFSNFDGMTKAQFLWKELDMINEFYRREDPTWSEEHDKIRTVLFTDIVNSVHLCGDYVYQWTHSLPSGCAMTAQLNTINNSIIMRLAYLWAAKKYCPLMKGMFLDNVSMIAFGDDNVLNISERVLDWYNQETIAQVLAENDIIYTDETKSASVNLYRSLDQIEFLKRRFTWDEILARYIAPLRPEVIYEMMNWIRSDRDPITQTLDNLRIAQGEASLHGKEFYTEFKRSFDALIVEFNLEYVIPSFEDAHFQTLTGQNYGINFN
jgi:hypothetical protein